jgi:uncharacterized GH25 family protein
MKDHLFLPLLFLFLIAALSASAQDSYLMPDKFQLHKGEKLSVRLLYGDEFKNDGEYKYDAALTTKFMLFSGGKKIDLITASKDSAAPVLSYPLVSTGLAMVDMVRSIPPTAYDRDDYAKILADEGMTKLAETVNNSNQSRFTEKKVCYMKTIVKVDKPNGGDYDKQLGDDYEIVLKGNPYKINYGDDISAILYIKGKPAPATPVDVFVKTGSGKIYSQKLTTNEKGEFSIIASREGSYLIRCSQTVASTGSDADFESVQASLTFMFTSINDSPNSYDTQNEE